MHDGGDPIADPASAETPAAPRTRRITVLVGLDAGVRAAVAFVVGLVVARSLGPEALGTLALAIAVVTLLLPLGGLGTDNVLIQRLAASGPHSDDARRLLRAASAVRSAGAAITVAAALAFALLRTPTEALAVLAVSPALLAAPFESGWGWMLAHGRIGGLVAWRVAIAATAAGARLVIVTTTASVPALALVTGVEILALAAVASAVAWRHGARLSRQRSSPRAVLRESLPILLSGVFFLVMLRVDVFLVDAFLGPTDTGRYAAVIRFAEATYLVASVAVAAAAPRIVAAHRPDSTGYLHAYRSLVRWLVLLALAASVGLSLLAGPIVDVLLGAEFAPAAPVLAVYAWTAVPVYLGTVRDRLAIDHAITRTSVVNTSIGAGLNIGLNAVLLPTIGLVGAGIASLVSYTAIVAVVPLFDRRQRGVNRVLLGALVPGRAR